MFRKILAALFMLVMTLLVTLKHPVLGYCLCMDSYFTGDCSCELQVTPAEQAKNATLACPTCCAEEIEKIPTKKTQIPCDDCTEHLNVDVGDFIWESSDEIPACLEVFAPNIKSASQTIPILLNSALVLPLCGDPPPPDLCVTHLPVYLRYSVRRL